MLCFPVICLIGKFLRFLILRLTISDLQYFRFFHSYA